MILSSNRNWLLRLFGSWIFPSSLECHSNLRCVHRWWHSQEWCQWLSLSSNPISPNKCHRNKLPTTFSLIRSVHKHRESRNTSNRVIYYTLLEYMISKLVQYQQLSTNWILLRLSMFVTSTKQASFSIAPWQDGVAWCEDWYDSRWKRKRKWYEFTISDVSSEASKNLNSTLIDPLLSMEHAMIKYRIS